MMPEASFPPLFQPVRLPAAASSLAAALAAARRGVVEGAFYWADRADRIDAALVLTPDRARSLLLPVVYVAALALAEALGALTPPTIAVTFGWPDRIAVNGGTVGRLRLHLPETPPDAVPSWLVLAIAVAVADAAEEGGGPVPDRTSLAAEGCDETPPAALLAGFARHFLVWLADWEAGGWDRVKSAWLDRFLPFVDAVPLPGGGRGRPVGLDDDGGLVAFIGEARHVIPLEAALTAEDGDV